MEWGGVWKIKMLCMDGVFFIFMVYVKKSQVWIVFCMGGKSAFDFATSREIDSNINCSFQSNKRLLRKKSSFKLT